MSIENPQTVKNNNLVQICSHKYWQVCSLQDVTLLADISHCFISTKYNKIMETFLLEKKIPKVRKMYQHPKRRRCWGTYREAGGGTRRSAQMLLPPGVTAKRRLRGFKVDILIHARWIVVRHAVTRFRENNRWHPSAQTLSKHRSSTYTEEEREDAMLDLDLELVIWGYLMLEYSLSFSLFLCTATQKNCCLQKKKVSNFHFPCQTDSLATFLSVNRTSDVFSGGWWVPAPPPASSELYLCTAARPCRWTYTGLPSAPCLISAPEPFGSSLGHQYHSPDLEHRCVQTCTHRWVIHTSENKSKGKANVYFLFDVSHLGGWWHR